MTKAQMQAVVVAVTNAGYRVDAEPNGDGTWIVYARSNAPDVLATSVVNLAAAQGVTGFVREALFT